MEFARLEGTDVREFLALRRHALTSDPGRFRYSVADDEGIPEASWRSRLDGSFVAGAREGGRLVGMAGFTRLEGDRLAHKGLVWGMYVRPECRGAGAADRLIEMLLRHARTKVEIVQLTVLRPNRRARVFYERHGFREYAVEPRSVRFGDEFLDEVLMWLPLDHQAHLPPASA